MAAVVCSGVSPRSLGDLLKGFGIMAIVGENCPNTLFWWDDAFHLAVERPCDDGADQRESRQAIEDVVRCSLLAWGKSISDRFRPRRGEKCVQPVPCPYRGVTGVKEGSANCQELGSAQARADNHDELDPSDCEHGTRDRCPAAGQGDPLNFSDASDARRPNRTRCSRPMGRREAATTSPRSRRQSRRPEVPPWTSPGHSSQKGIRRSSRSSTVATSSFPSR
jgi:hypothetical protein